MSNLKEKIANFYFRNHKIEDKLGNDPHLEESMLGTLQNTAMNVRAKTAVLGFALAESFNMAVGLSDYSLAYTVIGSAIAVGILEKYTRNKEKSDVAPEYYIDTAPEGEVTYPNDESVMNTIWRDYEEYSPQRTAYFIFPVVGVASAIAYPLGGAEIIPFFAAGAAMAGVEDSRKYWQARQVLHENWQIYTTKPEKQTERSRQSQSAPTPNT